MNKILAQLFIGTHLMTVILSHLLLHKKEKDSKIKGVIRSPACLLVNDLDEGGLIVTRGLKAVQVHDGSSYVSQSAIGHISAESDTGCQPRATNCNRNL